MTPLLLLLLLPPSLSWTPPTIHLFNSLTLTKEPFTALQPPSVSLYTCGPTVYDSAHVGNFRAFLTYDVLKRVLQYFGYNVDHVCNLTDVDDKIIKRCEREGVGLVELTRKYEGVFMQDLEALNIIKARCYPRATEHIGEMVQMIRDLEEKGLAYRTKEGSWYFDVGKKEGYGQQLVQLDVDSMKLGAGNAGSRRGTDADEYDADKQGLQDFALWKAYKPDFDREDAVWDTEIGKGRPGWHLECSAMARKYLGDTIDLHCGGIDLKFPHHENEIAQTEGATGKKFCNCWLHNGFVNINSEKMSKSKGNFLTLRTACPKPDDVRAFRYLAVSSHYRNPLSFTDAAIKAAKSALKRIDAVKAQIDDTLRNHDFSQNEESVIAAQVEKHLQNFEIALKDDLSMPRASASLFAVVKLLESQFKSQESDLPGIASAQAALSKMDEVFGIFYKVPLTEEEVLAEEDEVEVPSEVMELVEKRAEAKEVKDWEMADAIRNRVMELGFAIKDVKGGDPIVSRID